MKKSTMNLLLIGGAVAFGAWFMFGRRSNGGAAATQQIGQDAGVAIAQAQAAAAIAQADAAAAAARAAADTPWYMPLVQGLGQGTAGFLSGLGGMFGA